MNFIHSPQMSTSLEGMISALVFPSPTDEIFPSVSAALYSISNCFSLNFVLIFAVFLSSSVLVNAWRWF